MHIPSLKSTPSSVLVVVLIAVFATSASAGPTGGDVELWSPADLLADMGDIEPFKVDSYILLCDLSNVYNIQYPFRSPRPWKRGRR